MKARITVLRTASLIAAIALLVPGTFAQRRHENALIDIWAQGKPAFGVYVPAVTPTSAEQIQTLQSQIQTLQNQIQTLQNLPAAGARGGGAGARGAGGGGGGVGARGQGQRGAPQAQRYTKAIGETLGKNPLYDFAFLNLEGAYDGAYVKAIAEGLRSPGASHRVSLLVRIPSIADAGEEITRFRVREALELGADGVTIPHVRSLEEARLAISFFDHVKNTVWSPANPNGEKIAMLMLEDPQALTQSKEIADLPGYSILACGIGSMGGAFRSGGVVNGLTYLGLLPQDQAAQLGELATQRILTETKRAKLANMLTANPNDVEKRVREGFTALLMQGPTADEAIRLGRAAAGRQ